jgi:hypothetical protein
LDFLDELKGQIPEQDLNIHTLHKREGLIFRGHPAFRGPKPWRDWALFDWGGQNNTLPGQIWCFVVVKNLTKASRIRHGGIDVVNGTYAVIESAEFVTPSQETDISDIFVPIKKDVIQTRTERRGWRRKFWLCDVESITKPLVVVPNIGSKTGNEFFIVRQRQEWVDEFKKWLDTTSNNDVIGRGEPIPTHSL